MGALAAHLLTSAEPPESESTLGGLLSLFRLETQMLVQSDLELQQLGSLSEM